MGEPASAPLTQSEEDARLESAYRIEIASTWRNLRKEPWYFWFFCAYIFFEYVRPQVIYSWLDFLPWGQVTILGAFFFRLVDTERKSIRSPVTLPFLLFFGVVILSCFFATYPQVSLKNYPTIINWILVLVLFLWIVTTRFRFYIVLLLFLLCTFKMSQHAARSFLTSGFSGWGAAGAPGFFQNAADLGVQLVIFLPLAVVFYLTLKSYWSRGWRLFFLLLPVSAVLGILGTGQRNTLLALAMMGIAFIFMHKHRFKNLMVVAIAAAAIWLIMPAGFKERFETAGEDETSLTRLHYWERGLQIYEQHPVIGIGYENWLTYYAIHYPGETVRWKKAEVAHSTPITILAELGTLGFITYYALVVTIFWTNVRSGRMLQMLTPGPWPLLPMALNLGLVGFLAASVFLSITYYPFLFFQAGFTAALFCIAKKEAINARFAASARESERERPALAGKAYR